MCSVKSQWPLLFDPLPNSTSSLSPSGLLCEIRRNFFEAFLRSHVRTNGTDRCPAVQTFGQTGGQPKDITPLATAIASVEAEKGETILYSDNFFFVLFVYLQPFCPCGYHVWFVAVCDQLNEKVFWTGKIYICLHVKLNMNCCINHTFKKNLTYKQPPPSNPLNKHTNSGALTLRFL